MRVGADTGRDGHRLEAIADVIVVLVGERNGTERCTESHPLGTLRPHGRRHVELDVRCNRAEPAHGLLAIVNLLRDDRQECRRRGEHDGSV